MVFVSVYKKTTSAGHDFIVLLYHRSMTLMRFGQKMTVGDKGIDCCGEEEAIVLHPFMVLWWVDNGMNDMCYGTAWRLPDADRLFVEHLTPRWMLDSEIHSALQMLNAFDFTNRMHMGLLSLGLIMRGFKRIEDDDVCRADYKRVIDARKRAVVIPEEEGLHAAVMRAVSNCEGVSRTFFFWSSRHNPPQIRELVFH